jgi:hypothetical protein
MLAHRVYRHRPFLAATVVGLLLVAGWIGAVVTSFVRDPGYESALKALLFGVPLFAFAAFLVLMWRVRTVVDDSGVTQYWIRRSYRVRFDDITAVETEYGQGRWFLRLHCGEQTFEFIPCHVPLLLGMGGAGRPPRALRAVREELATLEVGNEA